MYMAHINFDCARFSQKNMAYGFFAYALFDLELRSIRIIYAKSRKKKL